MNSELQGFFGHMDSDVELTPPDDSAVFHARKKLVPEAYLDMNQKSGDFFMEKGYPILWNGFQVACLDGSTFRLPNAQDIVEVFPPNLNEDCSPSGVPPARLSEIYNPLNNLCLAFHRSDFFQSEQGYFRLSLEHLNPKHLFLADCDYDVGWIFAALASRQIDFCIRTNTHTWNVVKELIYSGQQEVTVEIALSRNSIKKCETHGYPVDPIRLCLIRVDLPTGEVKMLATSLFDSMLFPAALFKEFYQNRWRVEEKFKRDKCRICLENFQANHLSH